MFYPFGTRYIGVRGHFEAGVAGGYVTEWYPKIGGKSLIQMHNKRDYVIYIPILPINIIIHKILTWTEFKTMSGHKFPIGRVIRKIGDATSM